MQCAILSYPDSIIEEEPEELPLVPRKNANNMLHDKMQELIIEYSSNVNFD